MRMIGFVALAGLLALAGCRSYSWRSGVPENLRRVAVPVFRNEGGTTEFGNVVARQVLREFQREGTMRITSGADAALEVQGVVKRTHTGVMAHDRVTGLRNRGYRFSAKIEVTLVDRTTGKLIFNNRPYHATTSYVGNDDELTGERDASGRLAEDLARQIVDDVLAECGRKAGDK